MKDITKKAFAKGFGLLEKLSKPSFHYFQDKMEYDLTCTRYKSHIVFEILILLFFFMDVCYNRIPFARCILRSIFCALVCSISIFLWRFHPKFFRIFYTILCVAHGPIKIWAHPEGIFNAFVSVLILPLFTYVFTGSFGHFLFQAAIQIFYTNKLYKSVIQEVITDTTPEAFSKALTSSMNFAMILNLAFIILTHHFMERAYKQIEICEKKKEEAEKQKNFLLGFSHELRNLLNSLTGNVRLAGLEHLSKRAKDLLHNADMCGELLLHLVNNILDTGKVEIGELEINPVPTRIYDALEKIWGVCSELIKRKNLTGKMNIPKNLPIILSIDNYRLTQIFLNLVGNAVKFTDKGSIDITVDWVQGGDGAVDESCFQPYPFNYYDDYDEGLFEKQKTLNSLEKSRLTLDLGHRKVNTSQLKHSFGSDKGILKVSISDTGCGMTKEETNRLFKRFTQVSSDLSKRKLGTGLGLFISKQLCHRMQGEVKVFSQKNVGSSFIFCIPCDAIQEDYGHLQDPELTKKFLRNKKLKAMIVDDSPFNQTILKCFFEKIGIEVMDTAINGLEAYEKYSSYTQMGTRPEIVTMDLDMPVMNGKEAAKKIRQLEAEHNHEPCFLPIISGNCSESEIAECLEKSGYIKADGFLKKPASMEELLRATGNHFTYMRR